MASSVSYGGGSGGYEDRIAQMQALGAENDALNRKEAERRASEERTVTTEEGFATTRTGLAEATGRLSEALSKNLGAIERETVALTASNDAMATAVKLRTELAGISISGGPVSAASMAAGGGTGAAARAVAPVPLAGAQDPLAASRLAEAQRAQAQAEAAQKVAAASYLSSIKPGSGATTDDQAALLGQRDAAAQAAQAAKAQTVAARASVQAQEQVTAQLEAQDREQAAKNAADAQSVAEAKAETVARAQLVAALRYRAQSLAMSEPAPLMLGAGRTTQYAGPIGSTGRGAVAAEAGGPTSRFAGYAADEGGATAATAATGSAARVSAQDVARLAAAQKGANAAFQESTAAYAASSNALSRHGALTTEFLQALIKGQVTLKEFETQMMSTIGKFSGWVVAGAAIYGVYDAVKQLLAGATETQAGIAQLGRFIPGLGGPAGGGTGQQAAAESQIRDISTQFNMPIKEVVDSMVIMSRVFHTVADAGDATRAVLAAVKLDNVPAGDAQQYVIGIAQTLGFTNLPEGKQGEATVGLINSLNALQKDFGARVAQTLPGLARAAPAATAAGIEPAQLAALISMSVTAGIPGLQAGTAWMRSMANYAAKPQSVEGFAREGITDIPGQYGDLMKQVMNKIDTAAKSGKPMSGTELRNLSVDLGYTLQGPRSILPTLVAESQAVQAGKPSPFTARTEATAHPPSFQRDLDAVLSQTSERFKSLGIALENLGSELEGSGVLTPLLGLLSVVSSVGHAMLTFLSPLASVVHAFGQLPSVLKDVIGALVGIVGLRALGRTAFGGNVEKFIGNLPGVKLPQDEHAAALQSTLARQESIVLPGMQEDQRAAAQARMRRTQEFQAASGTAAQFAAANQGSTDPAVVAQLEANERRVSQAATRMGAAEQLAAEKTEQVATMVADIGILKDRQYTVAQRWAYAEEKSMLAAEEMVDIQAKLNAAATATMKVIIDRGAATGGMSGGVAAAGAGALAVGAGVGAARAAGKAAGEATVPPTVVADVVNQVAEPTNESTLQQGAAAVAGAAAATGAPAAAPRPPSEAAGGGVVAGEVGMAAALSSRLSGAVETATKAVKDTTKGIVTGPMGPFAGIMATQMIGGALPGGPGGIGTFVSQTGGDVFTGMMLGQMLGGSKFTPGMGAAAGLTMAGMQQGGPVGTAMTVGGGALLGLQVGSMLGPEGTVLGGAIGGVVGGVGGLLASLFGGGGSSAPPPQPAGLTGDMTTGDKYIQGLSAGGAGNAEQVQIYGQTFADTLQSAFGGTGQAAQTAQQTIQKQIGSLQADIKAFGAGSAPGQAAMAALGQQVAAALDSWAIAPDQLGQIAQQANTAIATATTQTLSAIKYGPPSNAPTSKPGQLSPISPANPNATATALSDFKASTDALMAPLVQQRDSYQQEIANQHKALADQSLALGPARAASAATLRTAANSALARWGGDKMTPAAMVAAYNERATFPAAQKAALETLKPQVEDYVGMEQATTPAQQIAAIKKQIADTTQKKAMTEQNIADLNHALRDANAQLAEAALSQVTSDIASASTLEQTHTRDPVKQAQEQLRSTRSILDKTKGDYQLQSNDPHAYAASVATDAKNVHDAQAAVADAISTQQQSAGALATANIPTTDPVGRATQDLNTLATIYHTLANNPAMKGSPELASALLNMINGKQALADAVFAQQQSLISAEGALGVANAGGDAGAAAAAQAASAAQSLALAATMPTATPTERTARTIAMDNAQAQLITAQTAGQDAAMQTAALQGQIAEQMNFGNDVGAANAAIAAANQEIAMAHTTQQRLQGQLDLLKANDQLFTALQNRIKEYADVAAAKANDPVAAAKIEMDAAAKQLAATPASQIDNRLKYQANYDTAKNAYAAALASQGEATIQFQLDMQQISTQQAINQLNNLLKTADLTKATRQQIEEEIRKLQEGDTTAGHFDLAPGNVKLPTIYDVNKAMKGAIQERMRQADKGIEQAMPDRPGHHTVHRAVSALADPTVARDIRIDSRPVINVYVNDRKDVPQVADALDRGMHTSIKSRLRAAGVK